MRMAEVTCAPNATRKKAILHQGHLYCLSRVSANLPLGARNSPESQTPQARVDSTARGAMPRNEIPHVKPMEYAGPRRETEQFGQLSGMRGFVWKHGREDGNSRSPPNRVLYATSSAGVESATSFDNRHVCMPATQACEELTLI